GCYDLRPSQHANVRPFRELVDEIARHALLEPFAAAEDGHAPCMGREEHGRLSRGVARTDDVNVEPVGVRCLAACRTVRDALPGELLESLDRQVPPGHAA